VFAFYYEHSYPIEPRVVVVDTAVEWKPRSASRRVKRVRLDVGKPFYTRVGAETYTPDAVNWLRRNFGPIGRTLRLFVINEETGEEYEQMTSFRSTQKRP
jgi:hypothetical protein